jgi:hypothetical protein
MVIICSRIFISLNTTAVRFFFTECHTLLVKPTVHRCLLGAFFKGPYMKTVSGSEDGKDCLDSRCWGLDCFYHGWVSMSAQNYQFQIQFTEKIHFHHYPSTQTWSLIIILGYVSAEALYTGKFNMPSLKTKWHNFNHLTDTEYKRTIQSINHGSPNIYCHFTIKI